MGRVKGVDFTEGGKPDNPEKTLEARERPTTTTLHAVK